MLTSFAKRFSEDKSLGKKGFDMAKIIQTYFISTGALSAMFTLNVIRQSEDPHVNLFVRSHYICNLAAAGEDNEERAIEKAKAYADAMRDRIGETDDFKVVFGGVWDDAVNQRRGKLSVRDTFNIEAIQDGRFPFGKNAGKKIADCDAGYILYFADKFGKTTDVVTEALAAACQGVALELGYIAKRDAARAESEALDAKSNFIGEVGQRMIFEGEVLVSFFKRYYENGGEGYWVNKVRMGDDLVACLGSKSLGEKGQTVKFKATIKKHDEYNGVKSTKVNRPVVL
jgi:hypothetical protein